MNTPAPQPSRISPRTAVVLFVLALLSPLLIAVFAYFSGGRPGNFPERVEMVRPPRPIQDVELRTLQGRSVRFGDFKHNWTAVLFAAPDCPESCRKGLDAMRRLDAQGMRGERVQRVLVLIGTADAAPLEAVLRKYPGTQAVTGSVAAVAVLMSQFALDNDELDRSRVYLVDPSGTLVMSQRAEGG